jgi:hypothetical protein
MTQTVIADGPSPHTGKTEEDGTNHDDDHGPPQPPATSCTAPLFQQKHTIWPRDDDDTSEWKEFFQPHGRS